MTSVSGLKGLASARTNDSIEFCGLYRTHDPASGLLRTPSLARRRGYPATVLLALSAEYLYLFRASSHLGGWRVGLELTRMQRRQVVCQPLNGEPFGFGVSVPGIEGAVPLHPLSLYPLSVTVDTRQIRRLLCPRPGNTNPA